MLEKFENTAWYVELFLRYHKAILAKLGIVYK